MPSCTSSSARSPCLTTGWSSTRSTLITLVSPASADHVGTSILTVVPAPGVELTRSVPPTAAARSRIDVSPSPARRRARGRTRSRRPATSRTTRRAGPRQRHRHLARARVPQRVVQRLLARPGTPPPAPAAPARARRRAVSRTSTPCARPASCAYRRSDSASPSSSGGARPSMTARSSPCACAPSSAIAASSADRARGILRRSASRPRGRAPGSRTAAGTPRRAVPAPAWPAPRAPTTSRLRSYSRALVRAIAACAANSVSSSSSRSVNSPELLVGHEDDAEHLIAVLHRHPEESGQLGMGGGPPPAEPGVFPDVGQPFRRARRQQRGQHPVLSRQRADRPLLRLGHPVDHELGERTRVVGHPERRVAGADQRARGPHDDLERVPGRQRAG